MNAAQRIQIDDATLIKLATDTKNMLEAIGAKVEENRQSSREVWEMWEKHFPMTTDLKTGRANVKEFINRIWDNMPDDVKTPKEKNPGQFYNWNTAEAKYNNKVARGLKAVYTWINANIGTLYTVEVQLQKLQPVLDAKGKPEVNEDGTPKTAIQPVKDEKGNPVMEKKPRFVPVVNEDERGLEKVFGAMKTLQDSPHISDEHKAQLTPIFEAIAASLRPDLAAAKEATKEKLAALKPAEEPAQPEAEKVVNE